MSRDRHAAETLADLLSQPWSEAMAQHGEAVCMRIRALSRALRREQSERHKDLARLHSLRTPYVGEREAA